MPHTAVQITHIVPNGSIPPPKSLQGRSDPNGAIAIDIDGPSIFAETFSRRKADTASIKNDDPSCVIDGMPVDTTPPVATILASQVFCAGLCSFFRDGLSTAAGKGLGQLVQHCVPNEVTLALSIAIGAFNAACTASILGAAAYDVSPPQYKAVAGIAMAVAGLVIGALPLLIPAFASSGTSFATAATVVVQRQIGNIIYVLVRDTVQNVLCGCGPRIAFQSKDPENPLRPNWLAIALSAIGYLVSAGSLNAAAGNALKEILETGQRKDDESLSSVMLRNASNSIGLNAATEGADGTIGAVVRAQFPDAAYRDNVTLNVPQPKEIAFAAVGRVAATNFVHGIETALKLISGVTPEILPYLVNCLVVPFTECRGAIVSLAKNSVTGVTEYGNYLLHGVDVPATQETYGTPGEFHHISVEFPPPES